MKAVNLPNISKIFAIGKFLIIYFARVMFVSSCSNAGPMTVGNGLELIEPGFPSVVCQ